MSRASLYAADYASLAERERRAVSRRKRSAFLRGLRERLKDERPTPSPVPLPDPEFDEFLEKAGW